eukprot:CAMPEP_0177658768 /NCGR_PEP_ID=MMETSP0447-20121125/17035_1 /TAXON_ID=0 /ORGANISM="Stygamoeba regulata, Strain BSH-02190019" /LENGTH=44 /DNA_ID= /DNA_START= /DNA_END= /DNA_ORIENTATION=
MTMHGRGAGGYSPAKAMFDVRIMSLLALHTARTLSVEMPQVTWG